ncbi:DUF6634 family protein [Frigidibacter sp. MR17.14]|uniref:DUF6634 family protein n=1 Tax=Frigidibacter sp. MR17.14 TaxID=3126509 RepID=UPI003012A11D
MSVLAEINDRRNPWREIARRSVSPLDPRHHPGPLADYARASGVWWDPSWAADLAAELRSIRLHPGALTALDELRGLGYRLALIGCAPMEHAAALRVLLDDRFEAAVFSAEHPSLRPGRELLRQLLSDLNADPAEVLLIGDTFASSMADAEDMGLRVMHFERGYVGLPHRIVSLASVVEQLGCFPRGAAQQSSGGPNALTELEAFRRPGRPGCERLRASGARRLALSEATANALEAALNSPSGFHPDPLTRLPHALQTASRQAEPMSHCSPPINHIDQQLRTNMPAQVKDFICLALRAIAAAEAGPDPFELANAPIIDLWQPMVTQRGSPTLIGYASGHPRSGADTVRTSWLIAINREAGWARTISRFYRLGQPIGSFGEAVEHEKLTPEAFKADAYSYEYPGYTPVSDPAELDRILAEHTARFFSSR